MESISNRQMLTELQEEIVQRYSLLDGEEKCEVADLGGILKSPNIIDLEGCAYKTKPNLMNTHSDPTAEGFMEIDKPLTLQLEELLNMVSAENESDTPDFILAEYLLNCLNAFNLATNKRTKWYDVPALTPKPDYSLDAPTH